MRALGFSLIDRGFYTNEWKAKRTTLDIWSVAWILCFYFSLGFFVCLFASNKIDIDVWGACQINAQSV